MNCCKNCNDAINGNYCSNCGQPAQLKRFDKHYIVQEIVRTFNVEGGIFYTIKKMLTSPGDTVRLYITEDRSRHIKPIPFLFITSLIYTFTCSLFSINANDFYVGQPEMEFPTATLFINWTLEYGGYSSIIAGFFIALWMKLFFRKSGYNLIEIFILFCYISGVTALASSVFAIVQGLTHLNLVHISLFITLAYSAWACGQFFDKKKMSSYIKSFLSCMLGFLLYAFLLSFIAAFIDIVVKP